MFWYWYNQNEYTHFCQKVILGRIHLLIRSRHKPRQLLSNNYSTSSKKLCSHQNSPYLYLLFYENIVKHQVEQSKQDAIRDNVIVPKTQEEYCINSKSKQTAASRSQSIQSSSAMYDIDDMFDDEYYESYSEDESSHDK